MCGIAGRIQFERALPDEVLLHRVCDDMHHRGPDDRGTFVHAEDGITVGFCAVRLAVIDPSPRGHQPMVSTDGRHVIVFNGEIYNYRELRHGLAGQGCCFQSGTDTEVVMQLLALEGAAGLSRLRGIFGLAYFDTQAGRGLLARDHAGIKPLFWAGDGKNNLSFASEMRTLRLMVPGPSAIRSESLVHYLRYGYIAHPHTIYSSMHCLPPGHLLGFDRGGVGEVQAWRGARSHVDPDVTNGPAQAHGEGSSTMDRAVRLRRVIGQAVARQREADVPVGTFLSGGLDSSIVAHHLAECTPGPIKTFTVGFAEYPQYDERKYARKVAAGIGSDHHEIVVSIREVLDSLPTVLDHFGQPFGDSSILPTALLSRMTRRHVTVALSGDGGDELFGGYWRYMGHESVAAYRRLPAVLRRGLLEPLARRLGASKSGVLANRIRQFRKMLRGNTTDPALRHQAWSRILTPEAEQMILTPEAVKTQDPFLEQLGRHLSESARTPSSLPSLQDQVAGPLNAIFAFDQSYSLPADMLYKVDLASMMHSLEVRVPLLDEAVMAEAAGLPAHDQVFRGQRKRLLLAAYRGFLPDEILDRPKMGFEIPLGEWFRGPLKGLLMETVDRGTISSFGLINCDGVAQLMADHEHRRSEHGDLLFALLALCWWRRRSV